MAMLMAEPRNSRLSYMFDDTYPIVNILPFTANDDIVVNTTTTSTGSSILFVRIRSSLVECMYQMIILLADEQWRAVHANTSARSISMHINPVLMKVINA